MHMRLTIKDGNKGHKPNGSNGAGTYPPDPAATRPLLATVGRMVDGALAEAKEGALQILNGVVPYVPRIHVRETNDAIVVTARLRDVDEDSVEVTFVGHAMKITGRKSKERELNRRNYRSVKKVFRTFERTIPIHCDVHLDKVVATFGGEFLRVHVPRKGASVPSKSVPVAAEAARAM
jgi:HSP20 family molecular chaperone IbpA